MKYISLSLLFLVSVQCIFSQTLPDKDQLKWNQHYKLQWSDFSGKPDMNRTGDAGTYIKIEASPYVVKRKIYYKVQAYFIRSKSWSRDTSAKLLEHERLHFDIAELYARKIRRAVSQISNRKKRKDKKPIHYAQAVQKLLKESNRFDIRYDKETIHGLLVVEQTKWEASVKQELKKLSKYHK